METASWLQHRRVFIHNVESFKRKNIFSDTQMINIKERKKNECTIHYLDSQEIWIFADRSLGKKDVLRHPELQDKGYGLRQLTASNPFSIFANDSPLLILLPAKSTSSSDGAYSGHAQRERYFRRLEECSTRAKSPIHSLSYCTILGAQSSEAFDMCHLNKKNAKRKCLKLL